MSLRCGTRSSYVSGCHCDECREANHNYFAHYYRTYRLPIERTLVPAAGAQEHVRRLRAAGMGKRLIAAQAGVALETVQRLARGTIRRGIQPRVEAAILAVQLDTWLRDATGAQRRVRALARLGWTIPQIAAAAGIDARVVGDLSQGRRKHLYRHHDDAIRSAYDRLAMHTGPSPIAARRAATKGWPPPLAWDDDQLDDPAGRPDGARPTDHAPDHAVVARVMAGEPMRTSTADRHALIPALARLGLSDVQIAERCRCTSTTVLRIRHTLDVPSRWAA